MRVSGTQERTEAFLSDMRHTEKKIDTENPTKSDDFSSMREMSFNQLAAISRVPTCTPQNANTGEERISGAPIIPHLLVGNLVDGRVVLHALCAIRELEGIVSLVAAQERPRYRANDRDLCVTSETGLEQPRELGISVRDIAPPVACQQSDTRRSKG